MMNIQISGTGKYTLELYDMNGKIIAQIFDGYLENGKQIRWNTENLPAGSYLLRWKNKIHSGSKKILLAK